MVGFICKGNSSEGKSALLLGEQFQVSPSSAPRALWVHFHLYFHIHLHSGSIVLQFL